MNPFIALSDWAAERRLDPSEATFEAESDARNRSFDLSRSVIRHPGLFVGAALAAGVVLGCLIKR